MAMRRIAKIGLAAAFTTVAGLAGAHMKLNASAAEPAPAVAAIEARTAARVNRMLVVPAPRLVSPMAIVSNRNGRFNINVTVLRVTAGIIPDSCTATIYNADATIMESATGPATSSGGATYRCNVKVNYIWNGIDDTLPLRIDVMANGIEPTFSAATYLRSSSQTQTVPVPADDAITTRAFSLRL